MMRAVFLDRDGVISENLADHVKSWEEFRFIPGALDALRWLHQAGFRTFVVTNQAIVNRGVVSAQVVEDIHARMFAQVVQHGGFIDDICYCPHDYHENCECRKPQPGMLTQLAARWRIDLARSYMVGDAWTDVAAGRAASCRTVMVRTGRGAEQVNLLEAQQHPAHHIAANLIEAAEWILYQEGTVPTLHERNGSLARVAGAPWYAALSLGG